MRNYFIQLELAANCLSELKFSMISFVAVLLIGPSAAVLRGSSFKATADGFAADGCFVTSYSDGGPGLSFAGGSVSAPACNYHGVDTSADSLSSADLASGVLRAAAHSVGVPGGGGVGGAGGGAMIMDTITFSAPALSSFFGNATLSVNYSLVANDIPPDCSNVARIQAGLQFGLVGDPQPATSLFSTSIPDCSGIGPPSAMITLSTGTLTMSDGQQWEISSTLGVGTTVTASADASNTAHLSINLPPGVTYTSASGVLLKGKNTVPEPSSLLLLGTGFVGLLTRFKTWKKLIR